MTPEQVERMREAVSGWSLRVSHLVVSRDGFFDIIRSGYLLGKPFTKRRVRRARGRAKEALRRIDAREYAA